MKYRPVLLTLTSISLVFPLQTNKTIGYATSYNGETSVLDSEDYGVPIRCDLSQNDCDPIYSTWLGFYLRVKYICLKNIFIGRNNVNVSE